MTDFVFRQSDYPANPAPGSFGIWPVKGFIRGEPALDALPEIGIADSPERRARERLLRTLGEAARKAATR